MLSIVENPELVRIGEESFVATPHGSLQAMVHGLSGSELASRHNSSEPIACQQTNLGESGFRVISSSAVRNRYWRLLLAHLVFCTGNG